jgi:hypothetical protein
MAVLIQQGDSRFVVARLYRAWWRRLCCGSRRDTVAQLRNGSFALFGKQAQRRFGIGLDHLARKEHGMMLYFAPHGDKVVVVLAGDMPRLAWSMAGARGGEVGQIDNLTI